LNTWSRRTGVLFCYISTAVWTITSLKSIIIDQKAVIPSFLNPTQVSFIVCIAVFFISSRIPKLAWLQPALLLPLSALPFLSTEGGHSSMYGLGLFVISIILLYKLDFFVRARKTKIIVCLAYLYVIELVSAFINTRNLYYAFTPVFFITIFLTFLYLAFNERVVVYLKETKPRLSLTEKGLSMAERTYIRALTLGQNSKEIASAANISESTVRNTLSRAYKKLGVEDKTELTKLIEKHELVD
jgi:DNA-binding CsgD family transcriptional regulator